MISIRIDIQELTITILKNSLIKILTRVIDKNMAIRIHKLQ